VFQRRMDGSVNFYRPWDQYKTGFGTAAGEYWLGLENLFHLTLRKTYELLVDMEDFDGNKAFARYSSFSINPEADGYRLNVSGFTDGGAGDSLTYHSGQKFSTFDKDQDSSGSNCAKSYLGAFWYKNCHYANPNGVYLWGADGSINYAGVDWYHWKGWNYSLKTISMKIRQLVMKGREDLHQLAGRLSILFPSLLSEENLRRISFLTSSKHRCVSSVEAFQEALQWHWGRSEAEYSHEVDDELMRFFERCRGYVEGVEKNRTALQEVEKFKHGQEMEGVRRRTAERLGLPHHRLTPDLVEAAFFLCSYELSIKSLHSPWCFLFDESDAKVLEYKSDLKQYWKRSHGHVISSLSSCPLFHHVFRTLDKAGRPRRATEASPEPASILVGHAETLLPLLSLLGLYKDKTPPTASNYHSQHGRSFRTSRIVPYAANLLFVLYDCQRGPRLQLLVNETPVRFPGLESEDAPLYRDVRATYRHLLDGCDFHRECEGRTGGRAPNTEL
ncbi:multiple inositol polyphosphate phosphatase 1-like protein, partial [Lates japonicus]